MASNRMWLIRRPSGHSICLGKRMAFGWYRISPLNNELSDFYEACEDWCFNHGDMNQQDDFALLLEDAEDAPCTLGKWEYAGDKPVLTSS